MRPLPETSNLPPVEHCLSACAPASTARPAPAPENRRSERSKRLVLGLLGVLLGGLEVDGGLSSGQIILGSKAFAAEPAHGVFPQSDSVFLASPTSPLPVVVTTFGILDPRSAQNWDWVCEDVTGETFNYNNDFPFEVLANGTWLLGTTAGLWVSSDHCTWHRSEGLETLYITQVQRDRLDADVIYASSSTGSADNALWKSDDAGETFTPAIRFGTTSTLRGFLQGTSGGPFYVVGWRDSAPYLWFAPELSGDPADWQEFPIPNDGDTSVYPLEIDYHDEDVVWLRFSNYETRVDSLVKATSDGTFSTVFTLSSALDAFASGPAVGKLYVGGRQAGLFKSADGGQTWSDPTYVPEAGCLKTLGNRRYQCTNNLADGVAVIVTDLTSGQQEDVLWFGDVHQPASCPSTSQAAQICDPYWESIKATAWLDQTPPPTPTPIPIIAVEGNGLAGGCNHGGTRPAPLSWALMLVGAWGIRRRRTGIAGSLFLRDFQAPPPAAQR